MTRPNPLRGPLTEAQTLLLRIVGETALAATDFPERRWPAWAWVQHKLAEEGVTDAWATYTSLPTIPRATGTVGEVTRPYGLVWRADNHTPEPTPDEIVGLSIAGLTRASFGGLGGQIVNLADRMVALLANLGEVERVEASPTPSGPRPIRYRLSDIDPHLVDSAFGLPESLVAAVFQREYFFVSVSERQPGFAVLLNSDRLRPYRGLATAQEYLDSIWVHGAKAATAKEAVHTPQLPTADFLVGEAIAQVGSGDEDSSVALLAAVKNGQPARSLALYARWWQIETWLRELAYVELRARDGQMWVDAVKAALGRQTKDAAYTHMSSTDLANPLAYLDYSQLVQVLEANWDQVGYALLKKGLWDGRQDELSQIRNRIGHLRRAHDDDLSRLEQTLRDLERGAFLALSTYNTVWYPRPDKYDDPVTQGWVAAQHPVAQRLIAHAERQYDTSLELTYSSRPWAERIPDAGPDGHPGALWHARFTVGGSRLLNIGNFWADFVEGRAVPLLMHMLVDSPWDATFTFAAVEGGEAVADAIGSAFESVLANSRRVEDLIGADEVSAWLERARSLDYRLLVSSRWNTLGPTSVPVTIFGSGGGTRVPLRPERR